MNYRGAVKAFFDAGGQIQLGVAVSVAAGPLGRSADVSASASNMNHIAATYAYRYSYRLLHNLVFLDHSLLCYVAHQKACLSVSVYK